MEKKKKFTSEVMVIVKVSNSNINFYLPIRKLHQGPIDSGW